MTSSSTTQPCFYDVKEKRSMDLLLISKTSLIRLTSLGCLKASSETLALGCLDLGRKWLTLPTRWLKKAVFVADLLKIFTFLQNLIFLPHSADFSHLRPKRRQPKASVSLEVHKHPGSPGHCLSWRTIACNSILDHAMSIDAMPSQNVFIKIVTMQPRSSLRGSYMFCAFVYPNAVGRGE